MTARIRLPILLLATAATLALSGCSPEQWALLTGSAGNGSPESAASPAPGGTDAADEPGDEANGCPVGAWLLDNATWEAELERIWRTGHRRRTPP